MLDVTTATLTEEWFANPDAWRYLAHHAEMVRVQVGPRTAEWRLLSRAMSLGADMATALDKAAGAKEARARAAIERPGPYVAKVLALIDEGVPAEAICREIGKSPGTIGGALSRAGCQVESRPFYRLKYEARKAAA